MTLRAYRQIPKSYSKIKREKALSGELRPTQRPDCSNLCKGIEDVLNGLIYKDDSQIISLHVEKWYSDKPRVEVEIREVHNE